VVRATQCFTLAALVHHKVCERVFSLRGPLPLAAIALNGPATASLKDAPASDAFSGERVEGVAPRLRVSAGGHACAVVASGAARPAPATDGRCRHNCFEQEILSGRRKKRWRDWRLAGEEAEHWPERLWWAMRPAGVIGFPWFCKSPQVCFSCCRWYAPEVSRHSGFLVGSDNPA
jgi:hypothetical protein